MSSKSQKLRKGCADNVLDTFDEKMINTVDGKGPPQTGITQNPSAYEFRLPHPFKFDIDKPCLVETFLAEHRFENKK